MEGDKEAYLEEASKALKRQRKILDELLAEKNAIQRQLRVTKSKQNRNKDAENAAKIARLAEEQDTLIIMIKREIQALKDLGQDHLGFLSGVLTHKHTTARQTFCSYTYHIVHTQWCANWLAKNILGWKPG